MSQCSAGVIKFGDMVARTNKVVIVLLCTAQDQFVFFSSVAVASLCDYFRAIMDNQKDGHFSYGEIHLYFSSVIYPDE